MPPTIPCTRATAQRVASSIVQRKRFATTDVVAVDKAPAAPVLSKRSLRPLSHELQMHMKLFPSHWEPDANEIKQLPKPLSKKLRFKRRPARKYIDPKWISLINDEHVNRPLSWKFGIPIFKHAAKNIKKTCPHPVAAVMASQTTVLDPTGARTRLFAKNNPECARVGDILLVRLRSGDPFAGVCINIRRRGIDTAILLRGQLTRVGVEMWYKIYSPLVEGIEVVQRSAKKVRRARLTYMRTVKHDRGSVENVVRLYLRQKAALGTTEGGKKKGVASAAAMGGGKKHKGRGKRR